ncbi:MAG TPA: hypothetical protein VGA13_10460 [Acidimicrobiales bacterium]
MQLRDRALGVSRRRRKVAYISLYAGYSLLKPALVRVAAAGGTFAVIGLLSLR